MQPARDDDATGENSAFSSDFLIWACNYNGADGKNYPKIFAANVFSCLYNIECIVCLDWGFQVGDKPNI